MQLHISNLRVQICLRKYVCKLYGGALVTKHQTNQSSLKIQENQNEINEPYSTFVK